MAVKQLEPGIYEVMVDRPDKFNALSSEIIAGLINDFKTACADETTRAIIFRGAQAKKFLSPLAGADLDDLVDLENQNPIGRLSATNHISEGINAIQEIREICMRDAKTTGHHDKHEGRVVVIGMVDGPCLAGGIEFMFGIADLVYATPRSTFGMREILFGGMGGWAGPQVLRERLGSPLWIKEMLLAVGGGNEFGDIVAMTAKFRGLLNGIYEAEEIEEVILGIARQIVQRDPRAVTYNLEMAEFSTGQDCTPTATERMVALMQQPAWVNGVCGFLNKGKK